MDPASPEPECKMVDPATRYTAPYSIWQALETGAVRLTRMSYVIELAKAGGVLPRRQDLPEEAFIPLSELKAMYEEVKNNEDGVLPIVSISFCWDTPQLARPSCKWPWPGLPFIPAGCQYRVA